MFASIGEITPPCGVPSVTSRREPFSRTPAFSHLSIIRRITPSVTRWSRMARSSECGIESKYLRTSTSITQYCPRRVITPNSSRSAWCAERPARKPYEQGRKFLFLDSSVFAVFHPACALLQSRFVCILADPFGAGGLVGHWFSPRLAPLPSFGSPCARLSTRGSTVRSVHLPIPESAGLYVYAHAV